MKQYFTRFTSKVVVGDQSVNQLESRSLTKVVWTLYDNDKLDFSLLPDDKDLKDLNEKIYNLTKDNLTKGESMLLQAYQQLYKECMHSVLADLNDNQQLSLINSSNIAVVYKMI